MDVSGQLGPEASGGHQRTSGENRRSHGAHRGQEGGS